MKNIESINGFHQKKQLESINDSLQEAYAVEMQLKLIQYNFRRHSHTLVDDLLKQLNEASIDGLFDPNFYENLLPVSFQDIYDPQNDASSTIHSIVKYPENLKELDLASDGGYSLYNWELLFHAPFTIAVHLSKNQRFAEAQKWFHYIFDPTSTEEGVEAPKRFWKFLSFRENADVVLIDEMIKALSDTGYNKLKNDLKNSLESWRKNPFQPHVIARNRIVAYQFAVVMKYLDNLIAWGDSLFRQDTMETINEAIQIYILAANLLGPKPQEIPKRGIKPPKTFAQIRKKLDDFGNAMVELEGQFPFNLTPAGTARPNNNQTSNLFGTQPTLYFSIPKNDKLLEYWDIVADRLFKIRHSMNIAGVVRQLPLFQPPIDPAMLVKAAAAGIDISSLVSGLNQPLLPVRSALLLQKAFEVTNEVRSFGNQLLSVLEKKDGASMALLQQDHDIRIKEMVKDIRYLEWKETEAATESLVKSWSAAYQNYHHFQILLGKKEEDFKELETIDIKRGELVEEDIEKGFDQLYGDLISNYEKAIPIEGYRAEDTEDLLFLHDFMGDIFETEVGGNLQLNKNEHEELNRLLPAAHDLDTIVNMMEVALPVLLGFPEFRTIIAYMGMGGDIEPGSGFKLSKIVEYTTRFMRGEASELRYFASRASKLGEYNRRMQDWILKNNLAANELMQIGRQIITSLIKEKIQQKGYENQVKLIEQAKEIKQFLETKFTNEELYGWMQGQLSKLYYDCYKFAFDIAKQAEQSMKREIMRKEFGDIDFIKFNYWDAGRKGLLSGEALYMDLKRMEMKFFEHNKREYELTKNVSLRQVNPIALLALKANGSCEFDLPEWLFDLDCPGHYMRRIKTVGLTIPCVTGPYAGINCTLRLQNSSVRKSSFTQDESGENYKRTEEEEDPRFLDYYGTIQSIVTSSALDDAGLFETNLRDERYLPFEGSGVISTWRLELPADFRQFDYDTISDVILHIRYTAREGGQILKQGAVSWIKQLIAKKDESGLFRLFSFRHDFSREWDKFAAPESDKDFSVIIKKDRFPAFAQGYSVSMNRIGIFRIEENGFYQTTMPDAKLTDLNTQLAEDKEFTLTLASDDKVLIRKEKANVFLVLSYTLDALDT